MKMDWADIRQVAALVSQHLHSHQVTATLVGGACVSIYSRNEYQSSDLDLVTDSSLKKLAKVLAGIGFERQAKGGKLFARQGCDFILDFVPPPIAIGNEPVDPVRGVKVIETELGHLRLLTPTDCVKDRLAAYYHWNDPQSLEQALMVARAQAADIDLKNVERWSRRENHLEKFRTFLERLGQ